MNRKVARLLNRIGTIVMICLILVCIPFTVPKLFGLQMYEVKSESMASTYPVGSVVYVKTAEAADVAVGDAITYTLGTDTDLVMTHRVVDISEEDQSFITKGDENLVEDAEPVSFSRLIGKPVYCIKGIAFIANFINSETGARVIGGVFVAVLLMWLVAELSKKWSLSTILLMVAGMILVVVALAMLVPSLVERKQANDVYAELQEEYVQANISTDANGKVNPNGWYEDVQIDLEALQGINSEIVGWIQFDSEEMPSYPLLYSGDDDKYLRTDIYGNETTAGCIFIEGANSPDMSDYHTIIYGHNMKNLSMFGSLKNYKNEGFYEDNQYFTVYTEDIAYRYEIFAYRDVAEDDAVYTIGFGPNETYEDFIGELIRNSYKDTGVEVATEDRIVTLSTCSTEGMRFVVHAVRIEEHTY